MKFRQRPLVAALGVALPCAGLSGTAHAALHAVRGDTFTVSDSVSVFASSPAPGATATATANKANAGQGGVALPRFSPATGVLTGVSLSVFDASITQTVSVSMRQVTESKSSGSAQGTVGIAFAAPGAGLSSSTVTLGANCVIVTSGKASCSADNVRATPVALQASPSNDVLDAYVGESGTVLVSVSAPTFSVTATSRGGGTTNVTGSHQFTATGKLQADYTYLEHAAPSFDAFASTNALTLDFGKVVQGSTPVLEWAIFNRANAIHGVALDLDQIALSSPAGSAFDSGLRLFRDLAAGDAARFTARVDTSTLGIFETSFGLGLSDADVGVASTRASHAMFLTLRAEVTSVPEPVPLPAAWTLLLPGVALLGWRRRPYFSD